MPKTQKKTRTPKGSPIVPPLALDSLLNSSPEEENDSQTMSEYRLLDPEGFERLRQQRYLNYDAELLDSIIKFSPNREIARGYEISDYFEPGNEILPGLFLGSKHAARRDFITDNNISVVIDFRPTKKSTNCYARDRAETEPDFEYHNFPMADDPNQVEDLIAEHCESISNIIDTARAEDRPILLHCEAGISRSPSFIMAYLITRLGMTFEEADALVFENRACIRPNESFLAQLKVLVGVSPRLSDVGLGGFLAPASVDRHGNDAQSSLPENRMS